MTATFPALSTGQTVVGGAPTPDNGDIGYLTDPEPLTGIEALDRASWHVRKIAEAERELADLQDIYRRETDRLTSRLETQQATIQSRIDWHSFPVKALHAAIVAADPHRKTIMLPYGTLKARVPVKAQIFMPNGTKDQVRDWCLANHPDLCPPSNPLVTELRRALVATKGATGWLVIDPSTGEQVPGLTAEVPLPSYTIDTTGDDR